MTNIVEFEGLDQARKQFNNWQGNAVIFIDFDDMRAWTDVHHIPSYHAKTIVGLISKDDLYERDHKYSIDTLKNIANAKYKDYKDGVDTLIINDDYNYSHHIKGGNTYM